MEASEAVSGVPSKTFDAEPVVTVAGAGDTVNVPFTVLIPENASVTSSPSPSRIFQLTTTLSLLPTSFWLPDVSAAKESPDGIPSAAKEDSLSSVPS